MKLRPSIILTAMFSLMAVSLNAPGNDKEQATRKISDSGIITAPGSDRTSCISGAASETEPVPAGPTRLRVRNADGSRALLNDVVAASVGFPKSLKAVWVGIPDRDGIVSLAGLPDGTHGLLGAGHSEQRTLMEVTLPTKRPLLDRRLRAGRTWVGKNVELGREPVVQVDGKDGEVIIIEIQNQSAEALQVSEEDIVILSELERELIRGLSPKWRTMDREPFPQTTIEAGQTGQVRLNWREWVRKGLWSPRTHETVAEPGFPPEEPGKIWVKAGLGNISSLPVSVTDPTEILAKAARQQGGKVGVQAIGADEIQREQIGQTLGRPVYRDQVTREGHGSLAAQVADVFYRPVQQQYLEDHKAELDFTEEELAFFTHYSDEKQAHEKNSAAPGAANAAKTLRSEFAKIEARLASDSLTHNERQAVLAQKEAAEKRFKKLLDQNRELVRFQAEHFFIGPKLSRHLYEKYGGGRVSVSKFGVGVFDAQFRWLAERESLGDFEITDAKVREAVKQAHQDDLAAWKKQPRRGTSFISDEPEYVDMVLNSPFLPKRLAPPSNKPKDAQ